MIFYNHDFVVVFAVVVMPTSLKVVDNVTDINPFDGLQQIKID